MSKHVPSPAGPRQSCPPAPGEFSRLHPTAGSTYSVWQLPNMLITLGLDLFRTVRPGEYKGTGKGKDVDRASDLRLVGHRQLTQLAMLESTAALFSTGPHSHTGKQLA